MGKSHYIIPIFVPHEGCKHNCVFCNQDSITGSTQKVNAKYVEDTIESYLKTIKNKDAVIEVSFFGGSFTAIDIERQNELLSVAYKYKKSGLINYIHMSTRPDCIDEKILDNLKRFEADVIELGVQSLDDDVLIKSGRGHDAESVYRASELIKKYGFVLGHQIMLGLPGDNFKKDIFTVKKIVEIKPDLCRIYPALVIKNTPMEKMFNAGIYKPYSLEQAVEICKDIYGILLSNDINVIRVGLQPTDEITTGKELVAGPFHPAFRELVESSMFNDMIKDQLKDKKINFAEIFVHPKDISKIYSNKKYFFNDTLKQISPVTLTIHQDNKLTLGEIAFKLDEKCHKESFNNYVIKKYKKGYRQFV